MSPLPGFQKRATPRAEVTPTVRELEWAAGFLEGEGYFWYDRRPGHSSHRCGASQKETEPLERLQQMFGGSIKFKRQDTLFSIHEWTVYGGRARGVMLTLYSLLFSRRQGQIQEAIRE